VLNTNTVGAPSTAPGVSPPPDAQPAVATAPAAAVTPSSPRREMRLALSPPLSESSPVPRAAFG